MNVFVYIKTGLVRADRKIIMNVFVYIKTGLVRADRKIFMNVFVYIKTGLVRTDRKIIKNVFVYIKTGLLRADRKIINQLSVDRTFFTNLEPKQSDALLSLHPIYDTSFFGKCPQYFSFFSGQDMVLVQKDDF